MSDVQMIRGDCLDVLRSMDSGSVDAVVTDPPAGIAFMGKDWDNPDTFPIRERGKLPGGSLPQQTPHKHNKGFARGVHFDKSRRARDAFIDFLAPRLAECLRVARPGARMLCWALPRTSHWTATAVEDVGWLIECKVYHIFGSGFPKGKGQLKPAVEEWVLARKPGGKVPDLNIDATRITSLVLDSERRTSPRPEGSQHIYGEGWPARPQGGERHDPAGRWPANLALSHHPACRQVGTKRVKTSDPRRADGTVNASFGTNGIYGGANSTGMDKPCYAGPDGLEAVAAWECHAQCPVAGLDAMSGTRRPGEFSARAARGLYKMSGQNTRPYHTDTPVDRGERVVMDSGGASRFFATFPGEAEALFFYAPKASRRDRGEGNSHPTVKSQMLMRWLIRLVCKPGDTLVDPFAGSGSTLLAAMAEGVNAIGIEDDSEPGSFATAERRIAAARLPLGFG